MAFEPSRETIDEFRRLYAAEFGESLSEEAARRLWLDTMDFMVLLFKETDAQASDSGSGSDKMERTS